ncbi:SseB family protein [Amorphoplanes digitatis]|uniref:SseB protein N-terminal domain-containing protein n=1 Tax=Actinoplanes digitatis TaxID=1868 RepID=A0A7W7I5Q5_9ACTN|nr:SseB family protein [Actinoplanes digitatis]MBB4766960.1 hypothetical protein [Actinoplanes digitatis]
MTEWEPATDAEIAMRNALRTDDQESYFRILAGVDLLLPVSADALAGLAPLGWGTWSTGGRTHVLAFTSPAALQACLADYTGSARRVAYAELADTWPNLEWWLAVNPGLPIEGYLPAWFVAQLSRGDLRLPTRGPGREGSNAPERIQDLHAAATMAANAAAQGYSAAAAAQNYPPATQPGGPMTDRPMSGAPMSSAPVSGVRSPGAPTIDGPSSGSPAYSGSPYGPPPSGSAYGPPPGSSAYGPPPGSSAYGPPPGTSAYGPPPGSSAYGPPPGGSPYGPPPGGSAPAGPAPSGVGGAAPHGGTTPGAHPSGRPAPASGRPADPAGGEVGPGGLPLRTPGGVLPSGLPSRVPGTPQGPGGGRGNGIPGGQFNGFGVPDRPGAAQPTGLAGEPGGAPYRPGGEASGDVPAAYAPPTIPPGGATRPPSMPSALDALAGRTGAPAGGPSALDALGNRPGAPTSTSRGGASAEPAPLLQRPDAPLPTRTPMAQTPPLPAHIPPPADDDDAQRPPATADEPDQDAADEASPQATPQSAAGQSAAAPPRSGLAPPVIPGVAGAGRSDTGPAVPVALERRPVPPAASTAPAAGPAPEEDDFIPANEVERELIQAVDDASTDSFLSTLLLATVLVPVAPNSRPGSAPGESGFAFRTEETDGERFLVVFTSRDRLAEHFAEPARTVAVRFVDLIRNWPDPAWSFAVNPTSVIGARYPGPQVIALASWAVEAGLGGDPADAPPAESVSAAPQQRPTEPSAPLTTMQKAVPAEQVDYYLERGYDRVAGFVHRAGEVEHLNSPGELFAALGLIYDGSPYQPDAKEAFVLRWPAHRPSLYRIPYGGQSEQALRAMDGWVIERSPFRGNGFAPGEGKDVIAEFKVDSVRLPHGAELWRMDADGDKQLVAVFDCDAPVWRRAGEQ